MIETLIVYRISDFVECQIGQLQHIGDDHGVQCVWFVGDRLHKRFFRIRQLTAHPAML